MNKRVIREATIVAASLVLVLMPVALLGWYVVNKHRWAQQQLEQLEPRHARLLGLEAQKSEIAQLKENSASARTQLVYPSTQDANQTGNLAQQRIREIFTTAGLQIISSQVLPPKEEKGLDRIPLTLRTEGDLLAVQSALAVLTSQLPIIVINDLDIQLQGGLGVGNANAQPKLSAQFSLSVLRERS